MGVVVCFCFCLVWGRREGRLWEAVPGRGNCMNKTEAKMKGHGLFHFPIWRAAGTGVGRAVL